MTDTTTHGLPYPEATDPVSQGAAAIQALADALDPAPGFITNGTGWAIAPAVGGGSSGGSVVTVGPIAAASFTATKASWAASEVIGTVPAAYRPAVLTHGSLVSQASAAPVAVMVETDGDLVAVAAGTVGLTGSLFWML